MERPIASSRGIDGAAPSRITPARVTAATSILGILRHEILSMQIRPGEALLEKVLTMRFGVSRTPVREALMRLAEEGLVDIFPQSGTYVALIPIGSLPEAVVIRQALEGAAVSLAAERADSAHISQLAALIAQQQLMAELGDRDAFHAADDAFHEMIALASGHPGLWRLAHQAKNQIDRCRRLTLPVPGRMPHVVVEHTAILDAIRHRDKQAAETAMRLHVSTVLPDAETIRAQYPSYFR